MTFIYRLSRFHLTFSRSESARDQTDQGRSERRVLCTQASEDADKRRLLCALSVAVGLVFVAAGVFSAVAVAKESPEPFEILPGSFHVTPSTLQAGAHEDLTTSFDLAHTASGQTANDLKDTVVNLPPGYLGNNTAVPTCSVSQLINPSSGPTESECPSASQVGTITLELTFPFSNHAAKGVMFPVYNMEVTSSGVTAQLGFNAVVFAQILDVSVRPDDSGLTVTAPDIVNLGEPHGVSVTIWGVPASHLHDAQRGMACTPAVYSIDFVATCKGGGEEVNGQPKPFLSVPTSCIPTTATIQADSWEHPGALLPDGPPDLSDPTWQQASSEIPATTECERVPFAPSVEASPTTNAAESPTGLNFSMLVPQVGWEHPETIATANLKGATVTLPEGISLNPSAGSGLGYCTPAQLAEETYEFHPGHGCPPESKVGSVEIETPLLTEHATGSVYVAKPFDNPFNSLLALYIVAKVPSRGVIVKVAGKVTPNPITGQLVTTFEENPQVPFSKFTLKFRQGATSPLVSPAICGTYTAFAALTPWSAPLEPRHLSATFPVETGLGGGPCPSGATPPFHPGLNAGSINNRAGSYSPFYVRLSRNDGEQEITHFSIKLPPGVSGKLAGIPECSDSAIAQAKAREHDQGGAEEEATPSCPAASEIGHSLVEAGVGSVLAQAPGKMYLAGPYHGSNLSMVSITAAKVGPFDLGTVVVRFALKIDPETAEVSVDGATSDPIPHIVDGIPTHLRTIRAYVDRPDFALNPTSCKATSTASTVLGSGKDFVSEADDVPVTVTSPFQAADCAALAFKPQLQLSLKGGTKRGATPAFKAVLTYPRGSNANIAESQVTLPHSEFLEQSHIGTVCTRNQFKEGKVPGEKCPAASVYGRARAVTPILSEPLEGPVYLRSSSHNLPDLVAALHNKQVDIALDGRIDSVENGRIRNTFEAVPDAPVSKFVLEMQGGRKGLLVNSTNICKTTHKTISHFVGQNGKVYDTNPVLKAKCPKAKKKGKAKKGHTQRAKG
jgi:hypothetical protein